MTVKGVEIDGVYAGMPNTQLRFSGAYNDAYYAEFPNLAQPVENGYPGRRRIAMRAARTLPGSFKYAFNLGVDFRAPVSETLEFHTTATPRGRDKFNSDVALSSYAWIPDRAIVDLSVGVAPAAAASTRACCSRTHWMTKHTWRRPGTATDRRSRAGGVWCSAANCNWRPLRAGAFRPRRPGSSISVP